MKGANLWFFLGAYMLIGCSPKPAAEEVRQLRWLEAADPISDAYAALSKNDKRLVGVNGYTWIIPGVEEQRKDDYRNRYGLRILEGTSDVIVNSEHGRLVGLAGQYAKKYNTYILAHAK